MCTFANWAGLTLYLLEIFRNCLHPIYNRQPDILTSLCKYAPSAKDIAMAILHRWRIIKHSVRNNSAKHERATASLDLDLPLQFIFAVFLSVRCGFESVSRGRIRGHIKSHILNLCLSCFYSARIGIIYDFVRGDHLDKDERGSDEENMTDMLWVVSFLPLSWLLSGAGGEDPSLLQTPITLHISACLLDTSSWTLSCPLLCNPQTSAAFISTRLPWLYLSWLLQVRPPND